MKIELHEITIREIAKGYIDNAEEGVKGYGGLLNIRPKYQREFEPYKVTVDLSDREQHNYMYNPRLFAYDIYGYPEFWYLVLYANELHSELEFNMKRVHFYNAGIIRILDTIRDLETKYKDENDQEMTDIVVNNESVNANVMGSII